MTKQSALNRLESIMGRLDQLNYNIQGSFSTGGVLNDAMREVAHVIEGLESGKIEMKKKKKKVKVVI
jgi:hypothetical protein